MAIELAKALAAYTGRNESEIMSIMIDSAQGNDIHLETVEQQLGLGEGFFKGVINASF